jgi:hypothetical protein
MNSGDIRSIQTLNELFYKNFNYNSMNLFVILTDLSNAIGVDMFIDSKFKSFIYKQCIKNFYSFLGGFPKHCNLYYVINNIYHTNVPKWFADKYTDVDKSRYIIDS